MDKNRDEKPMTVTPKAKKLIARNHKVHAYILYKFLRQLYEIDPGT